MSPLRATRVVPDGWAEHLRPAARGAWTGTCRITRDPGPAEWDPDSGPGGQPEPLLVHEGGCRVQALPSSMSQVEGVAADQEISERLYLVEIDHDAPPVRAGEHGDVLTVVDGGDDPWLVGRPMRVIDIGHATLMWNRPLVCSDDVSTNNPPLD